MSGDDPDKTIVQPIGGSAAPRKRKAAGAGSTASGGARRQDRKDGIRPGDVLNNLYRVERLIAKGGMGQVFQGCNVAYQEELVAIKVILPHLAADPAVQAMFFKEARTLTRLSHPALVQYRTIAQEPQLGVFYIVTEFVDGPNLSDRLGELNADEDTIAALTRRLAKGLAAAHSIGAIHRDISPDNILLEGGKVEKARIIDFGIAKDLDPGAGTIVGDGFAGKLNYVAPEQLGDFSRSVGPWSDVYSLGLTILAVARGRDVDMGGSIAQAIDKRRAGPDLSAIPESLRPLLEGMLAPNPADRIRSMEEVAERLSGRGTTDLTQTRLRPVGPSVLARAAERARALFGGIASREGPGGSKAIPLLVGGALGLLLLVAVSLSFMGGSGFAGDGDDGSAAQVAAQPQQQAAAERDPAMAAQRALADGIASLPCSWIDVPTVEGVSGGAPKIRLTGASGDIRGAIARVEAQLGGAGVNSKSIDYAGIAIIPNGFCRPLAAFAPFRADGTAHLKAAQRTFEIAPLDAKWSNYAGVPAAKAVLELDLGGVKEFALLGVSDNGQIGVIGTSLRDLAPPFLEELGNNRYRVTLPTLRKGWSGALLLTGDQPFDPARLTRAAGPFDAQWEDRFTAAARAGGWKAEMAWFEAVNAQSDSQGQR